MRPLDPRLLRQARAARGYVALTAGLGVVTAALVVAQALLLAHALGAAVSAAELDVLVRRSAWLAGLASRSPGARRRRGRRSVRAPRRRPDGRRAARAGSSWARAVGARCRAPWHGVRRGRRWSPGDPRARRAGAVLRAVPAPARAGGDGDARAGLLVVLGLDWVSAVILVVDAAAGADLHGPGRAADAGPSERRLVDRAAARRPGAGPARRAADAARVRAADAAGRAGPRAGRRPRRRRWGRCASRSCPAWCSSCSPRSRWRSSRSASGCGSWRGPSTWSAGIAVLVLAPEVFLPLRQVGVQFHAAADGVGGGAGVRGAGGPAGAPRPAGKVRRAGGQAERDGTGRAGSTRWACGPRAGGRAPPGGTDLGPGRPGAGVVALRGPSGSARRPRARGSRAAGPDAAVGLLPRDAGRTTSTVAGESGTSPICPGPGSRHGGPG